MSRIGNAPVTIESGVEVKIEEGLISVKGPKGELTQVVDPSIAIKQEGNTLTFERSSDHKDVRAKHGLYRSLVNNMIIGVSKGFSKKLEFFGVGYRATATGQKLEMVIGYSHPVIIELPSEIILNAETLKGKPPVVTLESHDKQLLGAAAAKIRSLRKPEPFKGKGIRYSDEFIRRKAGKSAAK
ncbi:50S ribosomal protein L6 [Crocinitomix catalasitica]|uniref:50S ribosomal protein L6 n=1 Tax=Crocinitomix catalasitica TaxID=184607 RepID=UPI0004819ED6|nr:50S ribosomal protein L6 [Crocinitomix catalasitica]